MLKKFIAYFEIIKILTIIVQNISRLACEWNYDNEVARIVPDVAEEAVSGISALSTD